MTPAELLVSVLCYAAVIVVCVITLGICCLALVGFVLFLGWLASTFREAPPNSWGVETYPDGTPKTIIRFDGGQVGAMPTPGVPAPGANGQPMSYEELMQ